MKVHMERSWAKDAYDIWVYDNMNGSTRVLRFIADVPEWEDLGPAAGTQTRIEPTLSLPPEILELLLREAEQHIPVTHATERHLKDAIEVRDRLLVMVERADLIQVEPLGEPPQGLAPPT